MAFKSWLVGLPPTSTHWEEADASGRDADASFLKRSSSTPDLLSEAGTMRVAPAGTVNTRAQSASPRRQPTLEWKRRLVDGEVGYGDQTSLFGPSGLENMFARPQIADGSSQKVHTRTTSKKSKKSKSKSDTHAEAVTCAQQNAHAHAHEQDEASPRPSTSSSLDSEKLASLCETVDLMALRTATIKKAFADFLDTHYQTNQTNQNITDITNSLPDEQSSLLHAPTAPADNATERSFTETNLENISPVVVAKHTTIDGKVSYNAYSPRKARADIVHERKGIDKTDTSQRAREAELAVGDDDSAVSGADDGSFMKGARHISGFTDAPEVESDKPANKPKQKESASWDFTDPPMCESSELAAAARARGHREPNLFGANRLNSSTFDLNFPSEHGEDSDNDSMEDFDGTLPYTKQEVNTKDYDNAARLIMTAVRDEIGRRKERQTPKVTVTRASGSRRTRLEVTVDKRNHSPITSPTPKRRRTLHGSEFETESIKTVLFRDMPESPKFPNIIDTQPTIQEHRQNSLKRDNALPGEAPTTAAPSVLAQRKIARQRNVTPSMGPSTGDWLQECKRVIVASRANDLGGIQEADEDEEEQAADEERADLHERDEQPDDEALEEDEIHTKEEKDFNTKKSDNMKTLAPQEVAHLLGGEVKGMTFDKDQNRWVRSKSAEHRFLTPKDALSSDDDPFRDISDLTAEKSVRSGHEPAKLQSKQNAATTTHTHLHHDAHHHQASSSSPPAHTGAPRTDTPLQDESLAYDDSKLPGEESTLAHYNDEHSSDPEALGLSSLSLDENTRPALDDSDRSTDGPLPSQLMFRAQRKQHLGQDGDHQHRQSTTIVPSGRATTSTAISLGSQVVFPSPPQHRVPTEIRTIQVANLVDTPNANISNTLVLSDLPDFTVHEPDHERPSERALAVRLANYAALEANDPFALTKKELVKVITDIEGQPLHWEDLTTLLLASKGLNAIHGLDEFCGRVEHLDVSHNALEHVDGAPPFVRRLNASFNAFTSLTCWSPMLHLQYLDLTSNSLDHLDGLSQLVHLRELKVDDNNLTNIDGIIELDGLITFSAKRNRIQAVDLEHFKLDKLIELDLSGNNITSFDGLEELPCLRTLRLDSNPLGETMRVSTELPTLKHLSLRNCGLQSLSVECFPNLRSLHLDRNQLSGIDGLAQLKKLHFLSIMGQKLAPGVRITILDEYIDVEQILISNNELPRLNPDAICMSVKHLEASNIGLLELPKDFGEKFPNLRTLDLSHNGIKDIRPLASLQRLEHLQLMGTGVDRLRKTVASLRSLRSLMSVDMRGAPLTAGLDRRDEEARLRRRTYEILIAMACGDRLGLLDGMDFDGEAALQPDEVMERLKSLGILRAVA